MSMNFATDIVVNNGQSVQTNKVLAPTASGGSTYGAGSSGQVLTSNGTNVYWATSEASGAKIITISGTVTNTSGSYSASFSDERITSDMKPIRVDLGARGVIRDIYTITCYNGYLTFVCSNVAGTTTVNIDILKQAEDPASVTSSEFDVLNNRKLNKNQGSANSGKYMKVGQDGELYPDTVSGGSIAGNVPEIWYTTCSSENTSLVKAVTINNLTELKSNSIFIIQFANDHFVATGIPQLQINNFTAVNIVRPDRTYLDRYWRAYETVAMCYDGTFFRVLNHQDLSNMSNFSGATSSTGGSTGLVPAPSAGDNTKFLRGDGTWGDGGKPMVILSYGNSTWQDFIDAYTNNVIVYCRASSNSNPATGTQSRMAFMAYVSNADNPTSVEFQYYRSVNSHSASQQGDQVYVYTLTSASGGTWSVITREASSKIVAGTNLSSSYSNGTITLNGDYSAFTGATSSTNGAAGLVPAPAAGSQLTYLRGDGTWDSPPGSKPITIALHTVTNTSGSYTHTTTSEYAVASMKAIQIECSNPDAFNDSITITVSDGSITLSCDDIAGTSNVSVVVMKQLDPNEGDPPAVTSTEFDILANRITAMQSTIIGGLYPVGSIYMSLNSTMPSILTTGMTWEAITGNYVLKTTTTETGGTYNNAGNTGSHVLTVNEIPSHNHTYTKTAADGYKYGSGNLANVVNTTSSANTGNQGGGQGHTHTAGMPQNVAIYMWKRTA